MYVCMNINIDTYITASGEKMKRNVQLYLDIELIERAKLNGINISKECNTHLDRLLSLPTITIPDESDKIEDKIKEKEIEFLGLSKELNELKTKRQEINKKKEEDIKEKYKWEEL